MIITQSSKDFENPETGRFNGTIIDVIDLGPKTNRFGESKVRLRIIWVLDRNDSEGNPFRVMREVNATVADKPKKSNLYEIAESVMGVPPAVGFDTEVLIGRSNELTIVREADATSGKVYANIKVILPLAAGVVGPPIPQGFVRDTGKAKAKNVTNGAPAVAAANTQAPPAQPTAQAAPTAQAPVQPVPQATAAPQPATTKAADAAF
jgi:hypothetical protein